MPLALQQPGLGPHGLRLGEAIYNVLRPAGFSDEAVVGTVYALHTYVLGFVALEAPRAGTTATSDDEFVRRLRAYFGALPPDDSPTMSSWLRCSLASPATTSSSSACVPSSPA